MRITVNVGQFWLIMRYTFFSYKKLSEGVRAESFLNFGVLKGCVLVSLHSVETEKLFRGKSHESSHRSPSQYVRIASYYYVLIRMSSVRTAPLRNSG